ncbi:MAG: glutathione synthase [Candidatus Brocadia sp.]|nr:Ribosomal protein S6--L-glutamate ligase [Anaerolineales bacterium]MDG5997690.1 ATP-grasp domain-containing protein [Candidatus Brocadia sp.]RIJ89195.1 MAG: glutathione synthase [Candidatus Brocadia sp.]
MILLCGIPSEAPMAMVKGALDKLGEKTVFFNQRYFAQMGIKYQIDKGGITGKLKIGNKEYLLEEFDGIYSRLMDDQILPELGGEPPLSERRKYCRAVHDTLIHWLEITPARVLNRIAPMASNSSKPYQAQLIKEQGFSIPNTLITNDPDEVISYYEKNRRVVFKSISGVRSIVQELKEKDLERLELIKWCPVQFQAYVEGQDVRVHVIGKEVFACGISTDSLDYRYASTSLQPMDLPPELWEKCIRLSQALQLSFAGIDLKLAPDGQVYCFEVNPSPGFSYYERKTGQPIAMTVARYLAGRSDTGAYEN